MYHDELWVMGLYSGYATPAETHQRFKQLLDAGQTGLSVALDLPTQMGLDSDHPLADGEVGKVGVPINTVEDLLTIFRGLPLERVRQMRTTANAIGPIYSAMFLVALEELGVEPKFRLLLQNDPLKEFSVRGTYIFPPRASVKLAGDVIEYFASELPHWEPIMFCGYHFRDAGATAVQEMAMLIADGIEYFDEAVRRGVDLQIFARSLFVFLSAGVDIFEEASKFRATRRIWARLLHERYGIPKDIAGVNMVSYTLGGQLPAQEPLNNAVRVAYQALAAVLGGVQTLATSSYDEALGLPTPEAVHLALRTQQILGYESGATKVVDPLAGSYYVEDLTDRLETEALRYVLRILDEGGAVSAIESGFIMREIAQSAYDYECGLNAGERPVVGVSIFPSDAEELAEPLIVPEEAQARQLADLAEVKAKRDGARLGKALMQVTDAAADGRNTIPTLIEAARERATIAEMADALVEVYGRHTQGQVRV
jgi:methylmalonyl-CoA mutase N-terminal domain/subunit